MKTVVAFTDTYLPTVNGVTYTVQTWRDRWEANGGRMSVVYPDADAYDPEPGEHPVPSVPFPFYAGFRFGWPGVPDAVDRDSLDVVHAHTPFTLGLAGRRLADRRGLPLVVSYHTPAREYARYISDTFSEPVRSLADRYERWFFDQADALVVPSETVAEQVRTNDTPTYTVSNGVDLEWLRPVDADTVAAFREEHGVPDGALVGYTGRHGYEKRLQDLLAATAETDWQVVLGGDGPARADLERQAADRENVTFLGLLDREDLPAFYSMLDAFVFPSPVETQGLVALEAIACGTPVVAVDSGALSETVTSGETGYHYPPGDVDALRNAIRRTLAETDALAETCLQRRSTLGVDSSIADLEAVYETVTETVER